MAGLPLEIIQDIFSRMPVKSLARIEGVNKLWYELINDSYLANIHAKRAAEDFMLIMFKQFQADRSSQPTMHTRVSMYYRLKRRHSFHRNKQESYYGVHEGFIIKVLFRQHSSRLVSWAALDSN